MHITLKQLHIFIMIVQKGNLTYAAESLFMTKGAVSQALAELERRLGIQLFNRQNARLHITPEGRKLLPLADELIARAQGVERLFSASEQCYELQLGCTKTIGSYLLPDLLKVFQQYQGWLPSLVIDNTQEICRKISQFEIDIAFIEGPCTENNLMTTPWLTDEMVVVAANDHPLSQMEQVSFELLSQQSWILRELGSSSRAFFDNNFALNLTMANTVLVLNAFDAILSCVQNNFGITLLSRFILKHPFYRDNFKILPIEKRFFRKLYICHHRDKFISPIMEELFKLGEKLDVASQNID